LSKLKLFTSLQADRMISGRAPQADDPNNGDKLGTSPRERE